MNTDLSIAPLATQLRFALVDLVTELGTRRTTPPVFHLGVPGGAQRQFSHDPADDAGLRADVLERALDTLDLDPVPVPWLTRNGDLAAGDLDYAWLAAAGEAFGRYALRMPGFFVMTRYGWFDLLDDADPVRCSVRPRRRRAPGDANSAEVG